MNAIAKKLQMKPGSSWLLFNAPEGYLSLMDPLPENTITSFTLDGDFSGIQLFAKNSAELAESMATIKASLKPDTILWIIYPKKSSGIKSDLEMTGNWDIMTQHGLDGVAAASIDQTWTALRFRPQGQSKKSEVCNDDLRQNEYGAYIDVDNKQVNLPPDLKEILEAEPLAMANYQKLSYSNKKEFVLWILTAKQEKTRTDRLSKMIEKLIAGKKNPSEK